VGPDGSGKTTIAQFLSEHVNSVEYIYLGSKTQRLPDKIKKVIAPELGLAGIKKFKEIRDIMAVTYHCVRYLIKYCKKIYISLLQGKIVIGDRYYYELLTSGYYSIPHFFKKLLLTMMPNPHLTILLTNDAKTIWERKKELTVEEIDRQINSLKKLLITLPSYDELTTNQSVKSTAMEIFHKIIALYPDKRG